MAELGDIRVFILTFAFAMPRILGMFTVLPFFSQQALPGILRMGVAASLSLMVAPLVIPAASRPDLDGLLIAAIVLKEVLIGFLLGYLVAILFWGIEAIGFFIDNQRGATMSSSMNPFTGVDTSILGMLLNQAITVFFFTSGAFLLLLAGLYETYALWPVDSFWPRFHFGDSLFFLGQLDRLMYLGIIFASPVIIAMFLSELGLALISRFAPQLQVFFLAMPIKSAVGVLVLAIYVQFLFDYMGPELTLAVDLAEMARRLFP
ncbi:type III secretion system export apparatus subunit SctT [Telmatospirillum sp. J64-1]|uniref:type III secretion system export apparatus subunit SctT n=1 Tax=Telmatospirillum sp. J64-1 TaxID=2502183 RepID=UPI00115E0F65|nr:type III secretion system export apparatus subunit SctT [Telmatospirillum sp. J64-1]